MQIFFSDKVHQIIHKSFKILSILAHFDLLKLFWNFVPFSGCSKIEKKMVFVGLLNLKAIIQWIIATWNLKRDKSNNNIKTNEFKRFSHLVNKRSRLFHELSVCTNKNPYTCGIYQLIYSPLIQITLWVFRYLRHIFRRCRNRIISIATIFGEVYN